MAQSTAPNAPRNYVPIVDREGRLTDTGLEFLQQLWRQVVAGFVIVPCNASGKNVIALKPQLHQEGARTLADGMAFWFKQETTTDGVVTAEIGSLDAIKVYTDNGASQASTGDVVADQYYLGIYGADLDSGAGGLVLY